MMVNISAVQEERFSRKKHDSRFPVNSIKYLLNNSKIKLNDISYIVYYEKPLLTFERLLETYIATAPRGIRSFISAMQVWVKEKLFLKSQIIKEFESIHKELDPSYKLIQNYYFQNTIYLTPLRFLSKPFEEACILCMDGVGEWATTTAWLGKGNKIEPLWEINFPHSLGLLYSAFNTTAVLK